MNRIVPVVLLAILATFLAGCFDPEPGEISVRAKKNGKEQGCVILVFNSKGVQVKEEYTDMMGIAFVKDLPPGTYTLKFTDNQRRPYPAERTVKVRQNSTEVLDIELTEAPETAGDAET
ncbi:hypothetical protein IIA79_03335 [bacterium]|nr:hypothetical protein [bacterium]